MIEPDLGLLFHLLIDFLIIGLSPFRIIFFFEVLHDLEFTPEDGEFLLFFHDQELLPLLPSDQDLDAFIFGSDDPRKSLELAGVSTVFQRGFLDLIVLFDFFVLVSNAGIDLFELAIQHPQFRTTVLFPKLPELQDGVELELILFHFLLAHVLSFPRNVDHAVEKLFNRKRLFYLLAEEVNEVIVNHDGLIHFGI